MNREEIEKTIDSEFPDGFEKYVTIENIKSFFFDTILLKVLRDIFSVNILHNDGCPIDVGEQMKGYIKEKYNITL